MRINSLLHKKTDKGAELFRVLAVDTEKIFAIGCIRLVMLKWYDTEYFKEFGECGENILTELSGYGIVDKELLDAKSKKTMYERFTVIAGVLPFVQNKKRRNELISELAETKNICKQTIKNYLCLYLACQNISILAPKQSEEKEKKNTAMIWENCCPNIRLSIGFLISIANIRKCRFFSYRGMVLKTIR